MAILYDFATQTKFKRRNYYPTNYRYKLKMVGELQTLNFQIGDDSFHRTRKKLTCFD